MTKALPHADPLWVEHGYGTRFQGFQNLMRHRIRDILLVSSLYDLYLFEEDGRLYELVRNMYQELNLSHSPELTRVATGKEAISIAQEKRFDLVITTLHIEDMQPIEFAQHLKKLKSQLPIVLLAFDNKELMDLLAQSKKEIFDQVFIWQGDFRLLLAIIKHLEDRMNVDRDTQLVGVQSILVIENDIRYYSLFLPLVYLELMKQGRRVISEGINISHKQLRQRARPKILLCKDYESAWEDFQKYKDTLLGIISDVDFPRNGKPDPQAGFRFASEAKSLIPELPILLHSESPENAKKAKELGVSFIYKNSPHLVEELSRFMVEYFSFGDFIFRLPDGREVGRAHDLYSLEEQLKIVPEESIRYHAERNHFSNWLKARTEFWLAHQLRPRKVSDFPSIAALREDLINSLREYRKLRQRGIVTAFSSEEFDQYTSIARIGGGSLGGKARGLSFVNMLIQNYTVQDRFEGIRIAIPPGIVVGTDVFDEFMKKNDLYEFALSETRDEVIMERFLKATYFPEQIQKELERFLGLFQCPLAVRSSSLLEDSHNHPFAGVYKTYMIPNNHPDIHVRLADLLSAIKSVYASTYMRRAKEYIKATSYDLAEEKMAVIIQKIVGSQHRNRFYPNFSGVARSYNFYPIPPQKFSDGIVAMALGFGKMVVEGGPCIRFSPKYPLRLDQNVSVKTFLQNAQTQFFALPLDYSLENPQEKRVQYLQTFALEIAEEDGTLASVASTYIPEDDRLVDGISRPGIRVVTFRPLLEDHHPLFSQVIDLILEMGKWGMGTPVEIEFAVNLETSPWEFGLLQMRPMVWNRDVEFIRIQDFTKERLLCKSDQVLGNGSFEIFDIVFVNPHTFDRSKTQAIAEEVSILNNRLLSEHRPYLLIGFGRWGSFDPWLGIPVNWPQIAGAKAIIEVGVRDMDILPSQGSHFFQNLFTFQIGYFTVQENNPDHFLDWNWLLGIQPITELKYTRHVRLNSPLLVQLSTHQNQGIILKPEKSNASGR